MSVAIVTGASRGLGLALTRELSAAGWTVVVDARDAADLAGATAGLAGVRAIAGDVTDAAHRAAVVAAAGPTIDLLVNNASLLGPSPQPRLADYPLEHLRRVYEVNVIAPLALIQDALPRLAANAVIVDVTSDASVEPYDGWGGYGSSKAALDQLTAILAAEHPALRIYAVDPGDMRTQMHQDAFPGEDISDRPLPAGQRPRPASPDRRLAAEWSLPGGRPPVTALAFAEIAPASGPVEDAGGGRSDVAMLVATRSDDQLTDARFTDLADHLRGGDLLVVNTSATLPAALPGRLDGVAVHVHLSTRLAGDRWVVELRAADLGRLDRPPVGTRIELPAGGRVTVVAGDPQSVRLAEALVELPSATAAYLARWGRPIRYAERGRRAGLDAYQTIFARQPGSAEMPSAGRPFTAELVTELVSRGILIAPIVLHAGVSSLEAGEPPHAEPFDVPGHTAGVVNAVHAWGGRVIAVGTTVVRALETVAAGDGRVTPGTGRTELVIGPERSLRTVDGLLTGWHEPESSHLLMLEAACGGRELLERSYAAAARLGYAGHEFGDIHLILP